MIGCVCTLSAIYLYWKGQRDLSVLMLFFIMTGGFQLLPLHLMVLEEGGISKCYDWVLVFAGVVWLFQPTVFFQIDVWKKSGALAVYLSFLAVLLYYSIFEKNIEASVALRVFRNFIFLIIVFLFKPLSQNELKNVWKWLIIATTAGAVVYCCQYILHTCLLNGVTSDGELYVHDSAVTRYYNVPVFICPVIFFLFFSKDTLVIRYKNVFLAVSLLTILLTQHRNLIIAVLCCYLLWLFINNMIKPTTIVYCLLIPVLFIAADGLLGNRLSKGMDDIKQTSTVSNRVRFSEISLSDLSTTEFRRLLFMERLDYIKKNDTRFLMGIGLLTDDSQKAKSLRFYIGIPDDDGNISQIANVDIAWASLLLQLGSIGTLLFVLVHLSLITGFLRHKSDPYLQVGILYLVALFISSFYGSVIAMPYTMCMVSMFAAYYCKITKVAKSL